METKISQYKPLRPCISKPLIQIFYLKVNPSTLPANPKSQIMKKKKRCSCSSELPTSLSQNYGKILTEKNSPAFLNYGNNYHKNIHLLN